LGRLSHARGRLTSRAPSRLPHWLGRPGAPIGAAGAATADRGVDMRLFGRDLHEHEPAVREAMAELSLTQPPPARGACTRLACTRLAGAALGGAVASTAADELELAAEARQQARTNRSLGMELRELAAERRELRDEIAQRRRRSLALRAGGSPQLPRDPHSGSGSLGGGGANGTSFARRLPVLGFSALSPAQASEEALEHLLDRLHTVDTRLQLVVVQIASQGAREAGPIALPTSPLHSPNPPPKHPSPLPPSLQPCWPRRWPSTSSSTHSSSSMGSPDRTPAPAPRPDSRRPDAPSRLVHTAPRPDSRLARAGQSRSGRRPSPPTRLTRPRRSPPRPLGWTRPRARTGAGSAGMRRGRRCRRSCSLRSLRAAAWPLRYSHSGFAPTASLRWIGSWPLVRASS
jgi:hypothetical protein